MKVEDSQALAKDDKVYRFTDTVKFKVEYPKDFKKTKHIKDGETIDIHVLQAENWQERGLGKIIK